MTDPRAWLDQVGARTNAATDGPWAPWLDQDGAEHMQGLLMVGNADGVIPDGKAISSDGLDANPIAHTYTSEDRVFIAHARTDLPAAIAALRAVLDLLDGPRARITGHVTAADIRAALTTALEDA